MKKIILLGACLWAFAAPPTQAQTGSPDIVVVKVLESRLATRIIIARSWGFPDELEVKVGLAGNETTLVRESAKKMQEVLMKLYEQGYTIKSSFGGSDGGPSTLVLVKG
jgi:hypothetical protein